MKFKILLAALVTFVTGAAYAQVATNFSYATDRDGKVGPILTIPNYIENSVIASTGVGQNITIPSNTKVVCFQPPVLGEIQAKFSGTGNPPATTTTDGTAWIRNPGCYKLDYISSSIPTTVRVSGQSGEVVKMEVYK